MDVFRLRNSVIHDYAEYVRSFVRIREVRLRHFVEQSLADQSLWPQPLIQMNPSFESGGWIDDLVSRGVLHPECQKIFRIKTEEDVVGEPMRLHRHQFDAIEAACSKKRDQIIQNPPDILLTNYVMLELLLTRPFERSLVNAAR
jgi:ATP-dependent helicase YprA (DUF1998 family)